MSVDAAGSRMRALMIYLEPTPYVLALVRSVAAPGAPVDVAFVAANLSQPWNLPIDGLPGRYLPEGIGASIRDVARTLRSGAYDVVHLAGWGHPVLFVAIILAALKGIPTVVESDSALQKGQRWTRRAAKRLVYPRLLRLPAAFLPGGTRQKRYLMHYGVPEDRIVIAQMTVDIAEVARSAGPNVRGAGRAALAVGADDCVFLYVGRLEPAKDIAGLLDAFAQVSERSGYVHLCVVGDGALRSLVDRAASSAQRVHFLGRLSGEALWNSYAAADVLVLPSLFEPWGLVVNEAMAAGLPVIASDAVGCVDDLVIDGQTGIVIDAGSRQGLASAMTRLAENPAVRASMGGAARRRIAGWTIEAEADIVVDTWRRVGKA